MPPVNLPIEGIFLPCIPGIGSISATTLTRMKPSMNDTVSVHRLLLEESEGESIPRKGTDTEMAHLFSS